MMKFLAWSVAALLLYFGLPAVIYAIFMFATWGALWNPGDWSDTTRITVAVVWAGWAFLVSATFLEFA